MEQKKKDQVDSDKTDAKADQADALILAQKQGINIPQDDIMGAARFAENVSEEKLLEKNATPIEKRAGLKRRNAQLILSQIESLETRNVDCKARGSDYQFAGITGQTFTVVCPKGCDKRDYEVYGNMIYEYSSHVCAAAIHAGHLDAKDGGIFRLKIANGESFYDGFEQNDITSKRKSQGLRSFIFEYIQSITQLECNESALKPQFSRKVGRIYTAVCPADCSKQKHIVYGDDLYSADSSICQAGIHAGLHSNVAGEIQFIVLDGTNSYQATDKNGISSQRKGPFFRSFKILGDLSAACRYFQEKFENTKIFDNWKPIDFDGASEGPNDWTLSINPDDDQQSYGFKQASPIYGSKDKWGTILINKIFECPNGVLSANIYFQELGEAGLIFRYFDQNNYYSLSVNKDNGNKMVLFKVVNSNYKELDSYDIRIKKMVNYSFKIVFYKDTLEVWLTIGSYNEMKKILSDKDSSVQRGGVGLATNGQSGAFFFGIQVEHYNPEFGPINPKRSEHRNFDQCKSDGSILGRKKWCKENHEDPEEIIKCQQPRNFCEQCCKQSIGPNEQIVLFSCTKSCVKSIKLEVRKALEEQREAEQ